MMGHPLDVERATQMHVEWCQALIERTGQTTTNQTEAQMRAVMMELRDSLAPEQVLAVASALPALERGIFLDGWHLGGSPKTIPSAEIFFDRVYQRVKDHHTPPPSLVADVFWLWDEKLEPAKARRIFDNLPAVLQPLWPSK
jgi:uncharacterized protein (DUF2267 family)